MTVLVAEATGNLVVALNATAHEHLLELLRALRQRVEFARVRTGRNDVVARAFRRGIRKDGSLHLQEAALVECCAHSSDNLMAQTQRSEHLRTAKVQVTPFHTGGLVGLDAVFDGERRRDGGVQHLKARRQNLDFARSHVRVHGLCHTGAHATRHLDDIFATQVLGHGKFVGAHTVGVDNYLRIASTVAQVDKDKAAMVAVVPHPAGEHDLAVDVLHTQLAARGGVHAVFVDVIGHGVFVLALHGTFAQNARSQNREWAPLKLGYCSTLYRRMDVAECPFARAEREIMTVPSPRPYPY